MHELVIIAMTLVAICLIVGMTVNGIVEKVMLARRQHKEADPGLQSPDVREIADRQQMIEDRLRVLERIATDRSQQLAIEIEDLRSTSEKERAQ